MAPVLAMSATHRRGPRSSAAWNRRQHLDDQDKAHQVIRSSTCQGGRQKDSDVQTGDRNGLRQGFFSYKKEKINQTWPRSRSVSLCYACSKPTQAGDVEQQGQPQPQRLCVPDKPALDGCQVSHGSMLADDRAAVD